MELTRPIAAPGKQNLPLELARPTTGTPRAAAAVLQFVDTHRWLLFASLVPLLIFGFNGQWRLEPDSALYIAIGRNLAAGRGYTYHAMPQTLAFPGLPLLLAGLFTIFHTESLVPALVLMPMVGIGVLALTYRLFLLHGDRPTAVMVTFGLGLTRLFYRYCFEILTDLPFLLGVMAFLVGYEAIFAPKRPDAAARGRWYDWLLLIGGLGVAVVMRPTMWALLLAVIGAVAWNIIHGKVRGKDIGICTGIVAAAGVIFYIFDPREHGMSNLMGGYEENFFHEKLTHLGALTWHLLYNIANVFSYSASQTMFGTPLAPKLWGPDELVGIVLVGLSIWLFRRRALWGMWVVLSYAMMLVVIRPLDRYFLAVLPLLIYAWWNFLVWLNGRFTPKVGNALFLGLFLLGGATNIGRIGAFVVEQHRTPFLSYYHEGEFDSIYKVCDLLNRRTQPGDWVMSAPRLGRILTVLSGRYAVDLPEHLPPGYSPARGPLYVLQPLNIDPPASLLPAWIAAHGYVEGPTLGKSIQGPYDRQPWTLHRLLPRTGKE
ncbi:MAG TPA: hypothetical protein VHY37_06675 [Tepidisphaeraceae bacterium]|nr:hypothetical protein [Tepidisphaeraceae bacterium]